MLFPFLLSWPDELPALGLGDQELLAQACIAIRSRAFRRAEACLLACRSNCQSLMLLAHLRLLQHQFSEFPALLQAIDPVMADYPFIRYLQMQYWLLTEQSEEIPAGRPSYWIDEDQEPFLALVHLAWLLQNGYVEEAQKFLANSDLVPDCPERACLQARVYQLQGDLVSALSCLRPAVERAPQMLELQRQYCELLLEAKQMIALLPHLRRVLNNHGENKIILSTVATAKLLQRQPGLARRAALLHRLKAGGVTDRPSVTNQIICYEQTGHSSWLEHLPAALLNDRTDPNLLANLVMQLASVESPMAAHVASRFCELMLHRNQEMGVASFVPVVRPNLPSVRPLRIAWLSGDVCDHPVGRFLLGFFHASDASLCHKHVLVSWTPDNPFHNWFAQFVNLELNQVHGLSSPSLIQHVRDIGADIVIDLSGWTANNFGNGLLSRLAPVQVNYLGYFASTGNPSLDVWMGDAQLFPEPLHEWHSEAIYRLSRCFLAWQPPPQLPEAQVPVPPPPAGGIRFGSFNHNRKFSDRTLRLWGRILNAIPSSVLVLKATAPGDIATLDLLKRRMIRCGLEPSRVIWLPLVPANSEHLLQYGQLDVALDCVPNGGCTTTCEALWMGVPVITLSGNTYVSRMSTAVLHGAGLSEWCTDSETHYLELAVAQAERLEQLRSERPRWRQQVQVSPLGDAQDLMHNLERAFADLHQRCCDERVSFL